MDDEFEPKEQYQFNLKKQDSGLVQRINLDELCGRLKSVKEEELEIEIEEDT